MRAMGIDPGTAICGFGVVDAMGSRLKPVTYGTVQTTPEYTDAERLVMLYDGLNELYDKYKPDVIGVEQLFFNRNVTTAIRPGASSSLRPSRPISRFWNFPHSRSNKVSPAMGGRRRNRSSI